MNIRGTMQQNLEDWVLSYSGCDGGILNASTWLCGIEWGYEDATEIDRKKYYDHGLPAEIEAGSVGLNADYDFFAEGSLDNPFNLSFAKMYAAIQNDKITNYNICRDQILKLNLSPIAFRQDRHSLWNNSLIKATGFPTKNNFIEFVKSVHRFSEIRRHHKPKIIVCIGSGYRTNFLNAFFGEKTIHLNCETLRPEGGNKNQNNRYVYHAKHDGTLLVVTPFSTSPMGLNSDYLLQRAGEYIGALARRDDN